MPTTLNDPVDPSFAPAFDSYLSQFQAKFPNVSQDQWQTAANDLFQGGNALGGGSNPYSAAWQVARQVSGLDPQTFQDQHPYDQGESDAQQTAAVDRSPEGQLRAGDTSSWNSFRDNFEAAAVAVANYYFPGAAILTSQMVSDGAQENLGDNWGKLALVASGVSGGMTGQMSNYGAVADSAQTTANGLINSGAPAADVTTAAAPSAAETVGGVSNIGGVSTNPNQMLLADAGNTGGTMTDVGGGMGTVDGGAPAGDTGGGGGGGGGLNVNGASGTSLRPTLTTTFSAPGGSLANAGEFTPVQSAPVTSGFDAGTGLGAPATRGLIGSAADWAQGNQLLTAAGLQVGGGLLKGVGDAAAAKEVASRNVQGAKELQEQKTDDQLKLDAAKRAAIQNGSYFDAKLPFSANGTKVLRRPDGTPVYNGGLINSR